MKTTTLSKEEFITRSMAGERFTRGPNEVELFYDVAESNPFRSGKTHIQHSWGHFDGKTKFIIVEKSIIERRWVWLQDYKESTLISTLMSNQVPEEGEGWYKSGIFIDVELPL